jgi:hypothetical protein
MADVTADVRVAPRPNLDQGMNPGGFAIFGGLRQMIDSQTTFVPIAAIVPAGDNLQRQSGVRDLIH